MGVAKSLLLKEEYPKAIFTWSIGNKNIQFPYLGDSANRPGPTVSGTAEYLAGQVGAGVPTLADVASLQFEEIWDHSCFFTTVLKELWLRT